MAGGRGQEDEKPGTVTSQNPRGGTEIGADETVFVTIIAPEAAAGEATGLFSYNLPKNPYPLPLSVEVNLPNGAKQSLANTNHSGGDFAIPYRLPYGSVISLSLVDREIYRLTVKEPAE
jgi:beta-lactam-binding protein with PASTA domain